MSGNHLPQSTKLLYLPKLAAPQGKIYIWFSILKMLSSASYFLKSTIFASEYTTTEGGYTGQLTWALFTQGFNNSPTLSDEVLSKDLLELRQKYPQNTLLQHVDYLKDLTIET